MRNIVKVYFGEGERDVSVSLEKLDNMSPRKIAMVEGLMLRAFREALGKLHHDQWVREQKAEQTKKREEAEKEIRNERERERLEAIAREDQERKLLQELKDKYETDSE